MHRIIASIKLTTTPAMRTLVIFLLLPVCMVASAETADSIGVWPRVTRIAASAAVNGAVTEALKSGIHKQRPASGLENNSFPSRHTSWAFTASTVLSNELGDRCPWVSVGAQAAATALGVTRVTALRHYGTDVAAGAAVGVLSTEAAYALTGLIFKDSHRRRLYSVDAAVSGLSSSSILLLPVGAKVGSAWGLRLDAAFAISRHWSAVASAEWLAFSPSGTYIPDRYSYLSPLAAARYSLPLGTKVLFEVELAAGPAFGLRNRSLIAGTDAPVTRSSSAQSPFGTPVTTGPDTSSYARASASSLYARASASSPETLGGNDVAPLDHTGINAGVSAGVLLRWSPGLASRAAVGYRAFGWKHLSHCITFSVAAVAFFSTP